MRRRKRKSFIVTIVLKTKKRNVKKEIRMTLKLNYFNYGNLIIFKSSFGYENRVTIKIDNKNKEFFNKGYI